jgi:fibronectin-binding autotransporter adhesin
MKPTHRNPLLRKFLLAPSILLTFNSIVSADLLVWKGSDVTNPDFWDSETTTNWFNSTTTLADVFSAGDTVLFNDDNNLDSPISVAIQAAVSPGGTTFNNSDNDYDVSGAAISTGNLTFSGDGTVTFGAAFGGAGNLSVDGTGLVYLNGANSHAGTTTISDGYVELGNNSALGTTDGGTTVSGTGTLDINARALGTEVFTISGEGYGDGALVNTGAQQLNAISRLTLAGDATIGATGRWDIRNTPTLDMGGFTLTKKGSNTVFIVDAAVSNPGNIDIAEGALGIQGTTPLDGGSVSHTLTIRGGAFLHLYRSTATLDWKMVMEDSSRIYTESATAGTQNTWSGPVEIADDATVTFEANVPASNPGLMTISGVISGTNAGFEKTGGSSLTLTNANTYTGTTTVTAGSIIVKNATALGTAAAGTIVNGGHVGIDDGVTVVGEAITINGNGANFFGPLQGNSGTSEWQGNVTIGSANPRIGVNAGEFTVSGVIDSGTEPYGITFRPNATGSATLIISGANTYLGRTWFITGPNVVRLADGDDRLPTGTDLFFGASGTSGNLDLGGRNQTVAGLTTISGTANGIRSDDPATLTVNNAAPAMFSGAITGKVSLTKSGAASMALRGANTTEGNITVNSGGPLELATAVTGSMQTGGVSCTLDSDVVTVTSTAGLAVGQTVTSTGGTGNVGVNRVIASIIDATTFTMSQPASATGNPASITFGALTAGKLTFHPTENGITNKLTGLGAADIKGTFDIDLTGADLTDGNEWTLVDVATANYDATAFTVTGFTVTGFTESPEGTWTMVDGANTWTFTQGDGKLTLAVAAGYASWADTYAASQTADLDHDEDGVENGIEYFLNATTAGFTASPSSFTGSTATWTNGGNIPSADYGLQFFIQTSPDLVIWTKVLEGDPNLSNTSGSVSYTLNGSGKQFVRLVVTPD